jgi:hypothetical protein
LKTGPAFEPDVRVGEMLRLGCETPAIGLYSHITAVFVDFGLAQRKIFSYRYPRASPGVSICSVKRFHGIFRLILYRTIEVKT